MAVRNYKIITANNVYTVDDSLKLWEEQEAKCKELGIDTDTMAREVVCHFFDSPFFDEDIGFWTVYDAIQCLAIKDGVDLVQYDNGRYGFVAYYNGNVNGFEIVEGVI